MLFIYLLLCWIAAVQSFTKVWVPAVLDDWMREPKPHWVADTRLKQKHGYSTFVYQSIRPDLPNYINGTRGAENSVYYRYIVDHYDDFPDVAIFTLGKQSEHPPNIVDLVGCISPNATYMMLSETTSCKSAANFKPYALWAEQCARDVLDIVWDTKGDAAALNKLYNTNLPVAVCLVEGHQFIVSRAMIHKRPLSQWKALYKILSQQDTCHIGEPDYENLYDFRKWGNRPGPETSVIPRNIGLDMNGKLIQAGTSEMLNHVIFGFNELDMSYPDNNKKCENFLPNCPHSYCKT